MSILLLSAISRERCAAVFINVALIRATLIKIVKIVPDMTYNVFGGTLNLAQLLNCSRRLSGNY